MDAEVGSCRPRSTFPQYLPHRLGQRVRQGIDFGVYAFDLAIEAINFLIQLIEPAINAIEALIDAIKSPINFIETLLRRLLKSQQIAMHVAHLIGQKAKAAFKFADPAFEVSDLGIVVHVPGSIACF